MSSTRQLKYAGLIQKDLSEIFQRDAKNWFGNAFITVTEVRVSPDLSFAKVFISLMMVADKDEFISMMNGRKKDPRRTLGNRIGKQVRIVPDLAFVLDETETKAQKIDDILSNLDIPKDENPDSKSDNPGID